MRTVALWAVPLAAVIFLNTSLLHQGFASDDEWIEGDKALHLVGGCAISMVSYNWYKKHTQWTDTQARIAAFATSLTASFVKECIDDKFSGKDLVAGTAGAGIGAAVAFEF